MHDFVFFPGRFPRYFFFLAENKPIRAAHKIYKRVSIVLTVCQKKKSRKFYSAKFILARTICTNSSEKSANLWINGSAYSQWFYKLVYILKIYLDRRTLIRRGHLVRNLFSLKGGINSDRINVKSCSLKPSADTKINVELEATIKDQQILKQIGRY